MAQTSNISQPSSFRHRTSRVPVHLQSVAALANQLLRSGTSIGANNAEATNAISKADFKSKSYIALKEARESLYWIELLKRNNYIDESQYQSIYEDCEELVKILVSRCKKLDSINKLTKRNRTSAFRHQPSDLVQARCKKINQETLSKEVENE